MAKVVLDRDWFAPDGTLYRTVDNPVTIPDGLIESVPKGTEVIEAPKTETKKASGKKTKEETPEETPVEPEAPTDPVAADAPVDTSTPETQADTSAAKVSPL